MSLKIYTKTGDTGSTSLIGGTRVSKSHLRIETYGTVDELNSHLGLLSDSITDPETRTQLKAIQDRLFVIGSSLAVDPEKGTRMEIPDLHVGDVETLEKEMDRMDEVLPEMKHFI
ncbi:MAG: ATP:cob(I)alamin adenosyltransferase, partial [Sphingobacteriaceae bacterium]